MVAFYTVLGLDFTEEQHGQGPLHWAAQSGPTVFEIYPAAPGQSTTHTRLGWTVACVDTILQQLGESARVLRQTTHPHRHVVLLDPEGHKVELTEAKDA